MVNSKNMVLSFVICSDIILLSTFVTGNILIDSSNTDSIRTRPSPEDYDKMRSTFINFSINRSFGYDLNFESEFETRANEVLMMHKRKELNLGFFNTSNFGPSLHIFDAFKLINQSKVFEMLRSMPKFGVLHAHDTALLASKSLLRFTKFENLWILGDVNNEPEFIFKDSKPDEKDWKLVSKVRENNPDFDKQLEKLFTMVVENPLTHYKNVDVVWKKFNSLFLCVTPIITYVKVWKEYFYEALKEFLDDGVQYLEFRGTLPPVSNYSMVCFN